MAGLLLAGCQKPVARTDEISTPNLAPDPAVSIVARPSTPPPPEYAPPGVFYLLAPVRKDTKDGIIRLLPGTEVKATRNGKYMTPEGEMGLPTGLLTNDMAKARAARNADKVAQSGTYPKGLPSISAAPSAPLASAAPIASASTMGTSSLGTTTSPFPVTNNPLAPAAPSSADADIRNLRFRLSVLKSEEAKLQDNLTYLSEKFRQVHHTVSAPSGLNGSTNLSDISLISSKLAAVQAEIQTLQSRLGTAAN